jgi:hypothetical protein
MRLFAPMAKPEVPLIKKSDFIVDVIAVGAFFLVFAFVFLPSHVPSENPLWVNFWSIGSAACMGGVFWIALNMFRVVFRYQKELEARRR